jgi:hypothetical protein
LGPDVSVETSKTKMASEDILDDILGWNPHDELGTLSRGTIQERVDQVEKIIREDEIPTRQKNFLKKWKKNAKTFLTRNQAATSSPSGMKDDDPESQLLEEVDSDGSESSEDFVVDSDDGGSRYRRRRPPSEEDDSDPSPPRRGARKSRKPRNPVRDLSGDEEEDQNTYELKFVFGRTKLSDGWYHKKAEEFESHDILNVAKVSMVQLQTQKRLFRDVLRDLVHDGKVLPCGENKIDLNRTQNSQLDELKNTVVPVETVDACVNKLDGRSLGSTQFEFIANAFDQFANSNSSMRKAKITIAKLVKTSAEGWLHHKGDGSESLKLIRFKTLEELESNAAAASERSATRVETASAAGWSNGSQASTLPTEGADRLIPPCLRGTPLSGVNADISNVPINDNLFWRDWKGMAPHSDRRHLFNVNHYTYHINENELLSKNVLLPSTRHALDIYAAGQEILHRFILGVVRKMAMKYPHLQPTVELIEDLGTRTTSLTAVCSKHRVVNPTMLTHYCNSVNVDVHIGAIAMELFMDAHYQTGVKNVFTSYADLLYEEIDLSKGLLAWFQKYRKDWVELGSSNPFERMMKPGGQGRKIDNKFEDEFFILYFKSAAEDLQSKLIGSTHEVIFQLFYQELDDCLTVQDILNLITKYHSKGSFQPEAGAGVTLSVSGSNHNIASSSSSSKTQSQSSNSGGIDLKAKSKEVLDTMKNLGLDATNLMIMCNGVMIPKGRWDMAVYGLLPPHIKSHITLLRKYGLDNGVSGVGLTNNMNPPMPLIPKKDKRKREVDVSSASSSLTSQSSNPEAVIAQLRADVARLQSVNTRLVSPSGTVYPSAKTLAVIPPVVPSNTQFNTTGGGKGMGKGKGKGKGADRGSAGKGGKGGRGFQRPSLAPIPPSQPVIEPIPEWGWELFEDGGYYLVRTSSAPHSRTT